MGDWMYTRLRLFTHSESSRDRLAPVTTCVHVCHINTVETVMEIGISGVSMADSP